MSQLVRNCRHQGSRKAVTKSLSVAMKLLATSSNDSDQDLGCGCTT
jgi:hypothetical protein